MPPTSVHELSDEMLLSIFGWLDIAALSSCTLVCSRWKRISTDDHLWKKLYNDYWGSNTQSWRDLFASQYFDYEDEDFQNLERSLKRALRSSAHRVLFFIYRLDKSVCAPPDQQHEEGGQEEEDRDNEKEEEGEEGEEGEEEEAEEEWVERLIQKKRKRGEYVECGEVVEETHPASFIGEWIDDDEEGEEEEEYGEGEETYHEFEESSSSSSLLEGLNYRSLFEDIKSMPSHDVQQIIAFESGLCFGEGSSYSSSSSSYSIIASQWTSWEELKGEEQVMETLLNEFLYPTLTSSGLGRAMMSTMKEREEQARELARWLLLYFPWRKSRCFVIDKRLPVSGIAFISGSRFATLWLVPHSSSSASSASSSSSAFSFPSIGKFPFRM